MLRVLIPRVPAKPSKALPKLKLFRVLMTQLSFANPSAPSNTTPQPPHTAIANMDVDWDNLTPFEPLISKSQQFPAAFVLMAIGSHYRAKLPTIVELC